eukprot:CAMPEP_0202052066 /NCGR_PEP_ID=MMETSP0963-20130614/5022_1 /ASSEMBLY_ACC=CAM_ASM_000494 /TAXON_ID=4773 /ORGANISM="Schizochytrium aggregatum, Strain ATCC28209" /LENGTH=176 /DNA_ID=CAMNT_0048617297 /DNA_START=502 /DNA_END=1034 /DNA_ORIENTATION=+
MRCGSPLYDRFCKHCVLPMQAVSASLPKEACWVTTLIPKQQRVAPLVAQHDQQHQEPIATAHSRNASKEQLPELHQERATARSKEQLQDKYQQRSAAGQAPATRQLREQLQKLASRRKELLNHRSWLGASATRHMAGAKDLMYLCLGHQRQLRAATFGHGPVTQRKCPRRALLLRG